MQIRKTSTPSINATMWSVRAFREGRKIAAEKAQSDGHKQRTIMYLPDFCDLTEEGVLTFTWKDDRYEPIVIDKYVSRNEN